MERIATPSPHGVIPVEPDEDSAAFWAGLAGGRLVLPRCESCGRVWFPPSPRCPRCASAERGEVEVPGTGRVYSWVVVRHPFDEAFAADVPYTVAVTTLDDADGARLVGRLLGVAPEEVRTDLPVRTVTYTVGGQVLPAFLPTEPPT